MKTTAAVALLLLAACDGGWEDREGWIDEGAPFTAPARTDEVLEAAFLLAPCRIEPWGGWITWHREPFLCGDTLAAGCFDGAVERSARLSVVGAPIFMDALQSALPHEIGHYVHARCDGDYSEKAADAFAAKVRDHLH
jgi:hypothetical protein